MAFLTNNFFFVTNDTDNDSFLSFPVDLVTLDDLSAEAMLESSQRIDHLAEMARTRLPPISDPGPPGALPPSMSGPNIFVQFYALLLRTLIYSQPWTLTRLLRKIVISASLSVLLGAIFWDIAGESNLYLRDRIGYHYASLGIFFWPLSLLAMCDVANSRPNVERDIRDGLYGRFMYILVEVSLDSSRYRILSQRKMLRKCVSFPAYLQCGVLVPDLSDISGAGVCDVGAAPRAGREPDVVVELPRRWSAVPDAAAPHLHVLRARVQVDVSSGAVRRRGAGRDDPGRWGDAAPGQSAIVVSAGQPDAVVVVVAVAAAAQERQHGEAGQLQAQTDSTTGHHYPGGMRATRRRVGSSRDRPRQVERTRGALAGHRSGYCRRIDHFRIPVCQVCHSEEAQKRPE